MIDLEITIKGEELKKKLNLRDGAPGKDGSPDTADDIRNKLELLQGDDRLDKAAIRGLEEFEKDLFEVKKRPSGGGGLQRGVAERLYVSLSGLSKSLTYNGDGSLNVVTDGMGTKTMVYTSGVLTSVTGTGVYRNKTLTYSSGALTAVTVAP